MLSCRELLWSIGGLVQRFSEGLVQRDFIPDLVEIYGAHE